MLRPCRFSQGHSTERPSLDDRGGLWPWKERHVEKNGMVGAWHGHGMASVNQSQLHCVNQMGKTHSKPLAERYCRETAWARHGHGMLCVNRPLIFPQVKMKIRDVSNYKRGKIETPFQTPGRNMWHCFVSLASIIAGAPPRTSDPTSTWNVLLPWKQQQSVLFWKPEAHLKTTDQPRLDVHNAAAAPSNVWVLRVLTKTGGITIGWFQNLVTCDWLMKSKALNRLYFRLWIV